MEGKGVSNLTWDQVKAKLLQEPQQPFQFDDLQFLSGEHKTSKTILSSYPRSGNTLIRSYIEKMIGIYTGSDCDKRRNLNKMLFEMGMKGEGLIDDSVVLVKTHYPERVGLGIFKCSKVILIVRNPMDSMASLFNMIATGTHSESIQDKHMDKDRVKQLWKAFVH